MNLDRLFDDLEAVLEESLHDYGPHVLEALYVGLNRFRSGAECLTCSGSSVSLYDSLATTKGTHK